MSIAARFRAKWATILAAAVIAAYQDTIKELRDAARGP
jgi:hypothetical protein